MEKVAEEANLLEALRRVCANKGSAGADGMDVTELKAWTLANGCGGGCAACA
jgi:hypothetical protein